MQDRAADAPNWGGIKIAEVNLSAVRMTAGNLINMGPDANVRELVSMPVEVQGKLEVEAGAYTRSQFSST